MSIFGAALGLGDDVVKTIDKAIPDASQAALLKAQLLTQIQTVASASDANQTDVEKTETASSSLFNKPHLIAMHLCLIALAYQLLLVPIVLWVAALFGWPLPQPPVMLNDLMSDIFWGLFGLSGVHVGGHVAGKYLDR